MNMVYSIYHRMIVWDAVSMGYPLPLDRIDTLKTGRFARLGEMGVLNAGPEAEWSVHGVADARYYTFV